MMIAEPSRPITHQSSVINHSHVRGRLTSPAASRARLSDAWDRALVRDRSLELSSLLGGIAGGRAEGGHADRGVCGPAHDGGDAVPELPAECLRDPRPVPDICRGVAGHRISVRRCGRADSETAAGLADRYASGAAGVVAGGCGTARSSHRGLVVSLRCESCDGLAYYRRRAF